MVKRSLAAANAIRAGNSTRRAMSRIMDLQSPCCEVEASEPSGERRKIGKRWADHQILQFASREREAPAPPRDRPLSRARPRRRPRGTLFFTDRGGARRFSADDT